MNKQILYKAMEKGEWRKALAQAVHCDNGQHAAAIQRAHNTLARPEYFKSLKRDIVKDISAGIDALKKCHPRHAYDSKTKWPSHTQGQHSVKKLLGAE